MIKKPGWCQARLILKKMEANASIESVFMDYFYELLLLVEAFTLEITLDRYDIEV